MTSRGVCAGSSGSVRAFCSRYVLIFGLGGIYLHYMYINILFDPFIGVCGACDVCVKGCGEIAIFGDALATTRVIETLLDGD
jgi:hypothetical protein